LRLIPTILEEAIDCRVDGVAAADDDDEMMISTTGDLKDGHPSNKRLKVQQPLSELRLGRRHQEFQGTVSVLCQPVYLSKLQQLQTLNLYDCGISNLDGIGVLKDCPYLVSLNLGRNPLQSLPEELALVTSLKEVWLDDCQVTGPLPNCLVQLPRLETLKIPHNRITSLPVTMARHMVNLKVLNLDGNPLSTNDQSQPPFPSDWSPMKNLEELYMRNCQLTHVPSRLPSSLVIWHLSSNQLTHCWNTNNTHDTTTTTTVWHHLPRLQHLSLNACHLTSIPSTLIQGLLLSNNNNNKSLLRLVISHNPNLEQLPLELIHAIRAYTEFGTGPQIVWQPNPQLESQLLPEST
jgi:Leucine-rich repeat (LRR) protein